ncbi:MAG: hypothetical protein COB30_003055 [Ectothiorhodospiraceae bacterium]|nr:hypothetical protein [Ectothiorhodospiraceae bacterium]
MSKFRHSSNSAVFVVLLVSTAFLASGSVMAGGSSPVHQMAEILHGLMHYPDSADKARLQQMLNNPKTSATEGTLARAILNVMHHANAQDIDKLQSLVANKSASNNEKMLAEIVLKLDHGPNKQDKARLQALMH